LLSDILSICGPKDICWVNLSSALIYVIEIGLQRPLCFSRSLALINYLGGIDKFYPPAILPVGDFSVRQAGFSFSLFKRGSKVFPYGGEPDTQGSAQQMFAE